MWMCRFLNTNEKEPVYFYEWGISYPQWPERKIQIFHSKKLFFVFVSSWKNSKQKVLSITSKIFLPTIFFFSKEHHGPDTH